MTVLDYAMMVEDSQSKPASSNTAARRRQRGHGRGGDLIAVALTDVLSDGLSMVYSFSNPPSKAARSAPS